MMYEVDIVILALCGFMGYQRAGQHCRSHFVPSGARVMCASTMGGNGRDILSIKSSLHSPFHRSAH